MTMELQPCCEDVATICCCQGVSNSAEPSPKIIQDQAAAIMSQHVRQASHPCAATPGGSALLPHPRAVSGSSLSNVQIPPRSHSMLVPPAPTRGLVVSAFSPTRPGSPSGSIIPPSSPLGASATPSGFQSRPWQGQSLGQMAGSPGSWRAVSSANAAFEELGEPGRQVAGILDLADFERRLLVAKSNSRNSNDAIQACIQEKKAQLRKAADQLKSQYNIRVDQQMRAQEMLCDQAASVKVLRLQQNIHVRRAQLEQQAAALTSEYSQRKVQVSFSNHQEELEQKYRIQQERESKQLAEQAKRLQASAAEVAAVASGPDLAATVINRIVQSPSMLETLAPYVVPLHTSRSSGDTAAGQKRPPRSRAPSAHRQLRQHH
mmetsp:Transcript_44335/g.85318  ORF Transcript_44335/g.85318 Transcript_44335/m.85318 type:complete len:376 (+) Transcript_44335:54-1181(+)